MPRILNNADKKAVKRVPRVAQRKANSRFPLQHRLLFKKKLNNR